MLRLSNHPRAFVRPSPSGGFLGGVTANSHEVISLCEFAGFNMILIETVGVGQSEIYVDDLCDIFMLILNPAAGDELQGIKKGIVEVADFIIVNKADGNLLDAAIRTCADYRQAVRLVQHVNIVVRYCSSATGENITKIMDDIFKWIDNNQQRILVKREEQRKRWLWKQIHEEIVKRLENDKNIKEVLDNFIIKVGKEELSPKVAAKKIIDLYLQRAK